MNILSLGELKVRKSASTPIYYLISENELKLAILEDKAVADYIVSIWNFMYNEALDQITQAQASRKEVDE